MICPRCQSSVPEVAHYCQVCGQDLVPAGERGKKRFAAQPNEPIASFALISSIMPREAGRHPQTYRLAFGITLAAALIAAVFGALPIAVLIAAFAIPVVYLVYLYDVNLWEDSPLPVTGLAFGMTGVLAALFTWLWQLWIPVSTSLRDTVTGAPVTGPSVGGFLIIAILVPIVGEAIRQLGPVMLASRPAFDDLMDGVTFGIASGVAYAAFDTVVRHWALLTGGLVEPQPGTWATLVLLEGFVKPLVMGTATGLAVAEFSGLGKGYDGFTPRYYVGVALAVGANIVYATGVYLLGFVGNPNLAVVLQLFWGMILLGLLILRLRTVLHVGLMEGALEAAARSETLGGSGETTSLDFCPQCEMPLIESAAFCSACGASTRARPKAAAAAAPRARTAAAATVAPAAEPDPAAASPAPPPAPAASAPPPVPDDEATTVIETPEEEK